MSDIRSTVNPMLTLEYLTTEHENKYFDRKSQHWLSRLILPILFLPLPMQPTICAMFGIWYPQKRVPT